MSSENNVSSATTLVEKTSKENVISNNNAFGGEGHGAVNGVANGYGDKHSSSKEHRSDKEKHREKDRNRDKSRDEKREKERRDKHSSSSKDKERSSHSSSSKDKDRKHREEKKDREHKSSSSKDKEQKSSSSSSHKDKEKHSSHSKDKSSSSSKEKHSSSSSSRDKEKEKSKSSSSSDKKPSSSSSSSKDKHRSKDGKDTKDKSKSSSGRDDDRHKEKKEKVEEKHVPTIKQEPDDVKVKLEFDSIPPAVKQEPAYDSEEEIPLAQRSIVKRELEEDSEDDVPLSARKKAKKTSSKKRNLPESEDSEDDIKPAKKAKKAKKDAKKPNKAEESPTKRKKKEEEEEEVWKWWEEEKKEDGMKWKFLEHLGPMFAPDYEPLPSDVKFSYDGKEMKLSPEAEEVATFYAKMLDHDYTRKDVFNKNFFHDWRGVMNDREREKITDLNKCNFKNMASYFLDQTELRKAMTKEQKKAIKLKNDEIQKEYGFCMIDGHKEKIGNFRIEPPGLFRGRGEHPKMGKLKKRVIPEQVIINCSKDSSYPKAPKGHKWKEVRHDNKVTWLASWNENVQGQVKYVMLNPSSKLKGEKDWQKYEVARELKKCIGKIRTTYQNDWKAKEMMIRQRAVALYFIDKLALRAGNEKDEDQADTVGCCSLRSEHISLKEELDDKKNVVVFDFLGKDSIRYYNEVSVEKRVFKNLQLFMQNKEPGDDLFDRLNTGIMNKHLAELMPGLSAKVFRTYNASITLQDQLNELTDPNMSVQEKILAYNRANRAVAILCNHQRAVPKTHEKSMGNMKDKISQKKEAVKEAEKAYKQAKKEPGDSARKKIEVDKRKKAVERLKEQLDKLNLQATDKEENKDIALGTSKLNYLDPRISVAWCKKFNVPIEKVYNKTQRSKFNWAIDMATKSFVF